MSQRWRQLARSSRASYSSRQYIVTLVTLPVPKGGGVNCAANFWISITPEEFSSYERRGHIGCVRSSVPFVRAQTVR